jgi:hypothetical protein
MDIPFGQYGHFGQVGILKSYIFLLVEYAPRFATMLKISFVKGSGYGLFL